jgi:putative flippase GtrA
MKHILKQFLQREAHPFIQFIKYGIAGGTATVVDILVFYMLSWKLFPALTADDIIVRILGISVVPIAENTRALNFVINRTITFLFSNFTAYLINILWVFERGRHKWWVEIGLFYAVSLTSYVIGTALGGVLIRVFGITTTVAYVANMVSSLMINYACRKYFIFKG